MTTRSEPSPMNAERSDRIDPRARPAIRHLVSIDDFSNEELLELFRLADEIGRDLRAWSHLCPGFILASLFFEPSTRTRLSFESAMGRLGGRVITAADKSMSSAAKGESLADTVRVVGGSYADIIVLRHPCEGAAKVAANYSPVPVINAGDGSHEHPTQTICDLYSLYVEKGSLEGLNVVLCGDLKYSRTIHSFAYALARFGANLVCVSYPGLEVPKYVTERLQWQYASEAQHVAIREFKDVSRGADVVYFTPQRPHQLSLFTEVEELKLPHYDALYVTRPQRERFDSEESGKLGDYLRIDRSSLQGEKFDRTSVMHPLPRIEEIAYEMDDDPRAIYFKQASRGVPVRMAIAAVLLGRLSLKNAPGPIRAQREHALPHDALRCSNGNCISNTERLYLRAGFLVVRQPFVVRCEYCESERAVRWIGDLDARSYGSVDGAYWDQVPTGRLTLFDTEAQALESGYTRAVESGP